MKRKVLQQNQLGAKKMASDRKRCISRNEKIVRKLGRYGMWQVTGIDRASQKSSKIQEYTVVQRFIKDDSYYLCAKWQETIVARRNMGSDREIL